MSTRDHLIAAFGSDLLALHEPALRAITADVRLAVDGRAPATARRSRQADGQAGAGIAVVPIVGPLTQRATMLGSLLGWPSYSDIVAQVNAAASDPSVGTILLIVDSPGGAVTGCAETARAIAAAGAQKRVIAWATGMAASAGYWLASSAREVYAQPSADVGSIGVVAMHADLTGQLEQDGVAVSVLTTSKYKAEQSPFGPLSDDAKGYLMAQMQEHHRQFVGDVARGRGVTSARVEQQFGQGRVMTGRQALAAGMVDGLADDILGALSGPAKGQKARAGASVAAARDHLAALAGQSATPHLDRKRRELEMLK
jgi:capsid assembly protease